jgi:hypothetical protein
MKAYLVRVGIDITTDSGRFNAPVTLKTNEFAYVPIKELRKVDPQYKRTFQPFIEPCNRIGRELPKALWDKAVHLDPDFSTLTYGDVDGYDLSSNREHHRGKPLKELEENDLLVFYAGLKPIEYFTDSRDNLTYAIIGLYVIRAKFLSAYEFVRQGFIDDNAHTRCEYNKADIIFVAKPGMSGRLNRCIPISEYRRKAYRVTRDLLDEWGDLKVRDGYIQRSVRLPRFKDPERFYSWFQKQLADRNIELIQSNN